uniref:phenylalanine--tRNA ligase n=1 Tax=Polysiphonia urceolata TaxID=173545 RepID=A0A1Z1MCF4_POLUR|nr:Phenylalanine-tRNA ligase beta subunit [Polysiphonia stricta]ARW63613.1 Phenylalanine-tRNA ligase beta subunit [Polysiphonia stricta]
MKFSWKLINNFIKLEQKEIKKLEKKLTLSGIEIENIDRSNTYNDTIIDLSITTNRKEISSALHLAIEISTIINKPLIKDPIRLKCNKKITNKKNISIDYVRIHTIDENLIRKKSEWLSKELRKHDIEDRSPLKNIQKYIKLKWGATFEIINPNYISKECDLINDFNSKQIKQTIQKNQSSKLLIFKTTKKMDNETNNVYNSNSFYENLYIDSIRLVSTITQQTISKYYETYNKIDIEPIIINVKKSNINKCLGNIGKSTLKFIEIDKINKILKQLQLLPTYIKKNRSFNVIIPSHRIHDLKREIDVIEEIGRIYEFKYFLSKLNTRKIKGQESEYSKYIKKFRYILRNLGLNEVINCGLTLNKKNNIEIIQLNNPITSEQKELRYNIVENLITNYNHNIKHTGNEIEIFEIGKTFKKNYENKYTEIYSLGGLISNKGYSKSNWTEKSTGVNFYHIKGIIETFLEQINKNLKTQETFRTITKDHLQEVGHIIKINRSISIYNNKADKPIGIIGEVKDDLLEISEKKQVKVYVFEININELIKNIDNNNNLEYINKSYTNYPSVIRDISIKIKKYIQIQDIKSVILKYCTSFVESIKIFNEYINKKQERFVGIRITYRSQNRTLNTADIKRIERNLNQAIQIIEKY